MKHNILSSMLLVTTILANAQNNHLSPAKDFSNYPGILRNYFDSLFPLLYNDFALKPVARYAAIPSFSKEYSFSVEQKNGNYLVASNSLSDHFWSAKNKARVQVVASSAEIDEDLFNSISQLFQIVARQIRKPDDNTFGGADGTTYYFSTTVDGEMRIGETWSPDDKSAMDRLVNICDKLYSLGKGKAISLSALQNEIDRLTNDLRK